MPHGDTIVMEETRPAGPPAPAWYKVQLLALSAELLGTLLFSFFGGLAPASEAAYANGLALAVLVYCCASVSGGHLNPGQVYGECFLASRLRFSGLLPEL